MFIGLTIIPFFPLPREIALVQNLIQTDNRMAWQWAETPVEIREILADIRGTTK